MLKNPFHPLSESDNAVSIESDWQRQGRLDRQNEEKLYLERDLGIRNHFLKLIELFVITIAAVFFVKDDVLPELPDHVKYSFVFFLLIGVFLLISGIILVDKGEKVRSNYYYKISLYIYGASVVAFALWLAVIAYDLVGIKKVQYPFIVFILSTFLVWMSSNPASRNR